MAINFPDSPSNGDTYTVGSIVYTWNGISWDAFGTSTIGGTPSIENVIDTHLNTSSANTGESLTWSGTDYAWVLKDLNSLGDVTISSLTNNDLLQYNSNTGKWRNVDYATAGVVYNVTAGTGLNGGGTGNVSLSLANTTVTPGSYTTANITVDAQGRITSAATGPMYTNSAVDAHLNTNTAAAGQVLSWSGTDYDWITSSSGGGGGATTLPGLNDVNISNPSSGQVLKYNGSVWINDTDATGGGGISNVVEDTTPQLGGNLDLNSNNITGTGNIDITGTLDVTGASTFTAGKVFYTNPSGNSPATLQIETGAAGIGNTIRSSGRMDLITNGSAFAVELDTTDAIRAGGTSTSQYVELYGAGSKKLQTTSSGVTITGKIDADTTVVGTITFGANGSSNYTFSGTGYPSVVTQSTTLRLHPGLMYKIVNTTGSSHPLEFKEGGSVSPGYADGWITGSKSGTQYITVPYSKLSGGTYTFSYQCTLHGGMNGSVESTL